VVTNTASPNPRDNRCGNSGSVWQRCRTRVCRGLHAGVLEAEAGEVGAVSRLKRRGGKHLTNRTIIRVNGTIKKTPTFFKKKSNYRIIMSEKKGNVESRVKIAEPCR